MRRQNSQWMPKLPTVETPDPQHIWKLSNWVEVCKLSKLPTHAGTSDRRNSWLSRHLKTSRWPLVIHTGHVRYEYHSELSKSVKARDVGTPDHCWNFRPSELPTQVGTFDEPTRDQQYYHCWANTGHVRPDQQKNRLALLSLKHSKLTWVGFSTYETLSINMMHPS